MPYHKRQQLKERGRYGGVSPSAGDCVVQRVESKKKEDPLTRLPRGSFRTPDCIRHPPGTPSSLRKDRALRDKPVTLVARINVTDQLSPDLVDTTCVRPPAFGEERTASIRAPMVQNMMPRQIDPEPERASTVSLLAMARQAVSPRMVVLDANGTIRSYRTAMVLTSLWKVVGDFIVVLERLAVNECERAEVVSTAVDLSVHPDSVVLDLFRTGES